MSHIRDLAQQIAERQSKSVEVICSGFNDHSLSPEMRKQLNTIVIQLTRNAVSHGIEDTVQRRLSHKAVQGEVSISLVKRGSGNFQLSVKDDGRGIDLDGLRSMAVEKGVISQSAASQLDTKKPLH